MAKAITLMASFFMIASCACGRIEGIGPEVRPSEVESRPTVYDIRSPFVAAVGAESLLAACERAADGGLEGMFNGVYSGWKDGYSGEVKCAFETLRAYSLGIEDAEDSPNLMAIPQLGQKLKASGAEPTAYITAVAAYDAAVGSTATALCGYFADGRALKQMRDDFVSLSNAHANLVQSAYPGQCENCFLSPAVLDLIWNVLKDDREKKRDAARAGLLRLKQAVPAWDKLDSWVAGVNLPLREVAIDACPS